MSTRSSGSGVWPHQYQGGVAVLDRAGVALLIQVNDGERGVADFADLADGQSVHDRPGAFADINKGGRVAQGHRGRQVRQDAGFDAAAQAVREDGNDASFGLEPPRKEDIAGDHLARFGALGGINVYKAFANRSHAWALPVWLAKRTQ